MVCDSLEVFRRISDISMKSKQFVSRSILPECQQVESTHEDILSEQKIEKAKKFMFKSEDSEKTFISTILKILL
jgi:hypothetical protein